MNPDRTSSINLSSFFDCHCEERGDYHARSAPREGDRPNPKQRWSNPSSSARRPRAARISAPTHE